MLEVNCMLERVRKIVKFFWDKVSEIIDFFKRIKSFYDFIREV